MRSIISLVFASVASATLSGNQKITTHNYQAVVGALDTNPVFCGYPGSDLDITRITAVQGLTQAQCGACLQVCNADDNSNCQYVMAVDRGGVGLDLNTASFQKLFNDYTGLYGATWNQVSSSFCSGILKSSNQYPVQAPPPVRVQVAPTQQAYTTINPPVYATTTTTTNPPVIVTTTTTTNPPVITTTTTTTNPPVIATTTTTDAYPVQTTTVQPTTTTTNTYSIQTTTASSATTTTTTDAYPINTTSTQPINTTTTTTTTTTTNAYPIQTSTTSSTTTTTTTDAYPVNTTTTNAYPVQSTTTTASSNAYPTITSTPVNPTTITAYPTSSHVKCHRRVSHSS